VRGQQLFVCEIRRRHFTGPSKAPRSRSPAAVDCHRSTACLQVRPEVSVSFLKHSLYNKNTTPTDGKRDRAVVPYGRTLGQNTARRGQRRAGQQRGDVEVRSYLRDQSGSRNLVFDLSITHDRFGQAVTCNRTGLSRIPRTLTARCVLMRSVKPTPINKHMMTIRTFIFSPLS
jgi:hypothetical protein